MAGLGVSSSEMDLDRPNIEDYLPSESIHNDSPKKLYLRDLLDTSPTLTEAAGAIFDDSFTRCFTSNPPEPWNWNNYLFPLWCLGVVIRYGILFPLRKNLNFTVNRHVRQTVVKVATVSCATASVCKE